LRESEDGRSSDRLRGKTFEGVRRWSKFGQVKREKD